MVEFVAAECPNCGAGLQLPADQDKAYCTYCGALVLIEKDAKKEVHYHKDIHYHYEDKVPAPIPKPVSKDESYQPYPPAYPQYQPPPQEMSKCSGCGSTNLQFFGNGKGICNICKHIFNWSRDAYGRTIITG